MKFVKVDELFIDILVVITPVAFVKEEVYLFVDSQKDFGSKVFVSGNALFVLKAVLFGYFDKLAELACQDAQLSKDVLACQHVSFELKDKGMVVLWYQGCHFVDALTSLRFRIKPPFCPAKILMRRGRSCSSFVDSGCILLNEKGENAPGTALWVLQRIPTRMFVNTPFGKDNFLMSIILEELVEFDIKASMGFAVVEQNEVLTQVTRLFKMPENLF